MNFPAGKSVVEVPFEVEGNWMVIPVSINGSRSLRFILDTGAQGTFLYNAEVAGSLNLKIVGKMPIRGAGGTAGEASVAENATFNIGGIELSNGRLVIPPPPPSQGMRRMGNLDGGIGRIVFATLVVEVDWEKRVLKFYDPAKYKYGGSGTILPLTFDEGGRPYTVASVAVSDGKLVPVKLVVDTGGSHALSLDVGSKPDIKLPAGATKGVLGRGAGGEIMGYAGQVKKFQLGGQAIENVPTIFPDSNSGITGIGGRQGSLGAGLLRRFKIIYDYSRKQMIVEPNKFFGELFAAAPAITTTVNTNVSPSSLQDYVGRYDQRTISAEDGALYLQRQGGPKIKLVPAAKDEFTIERIPSARIKFVRDETGKVTEIQVLNREGNWEKSKKETGNQPSSQSQNQEELSLAEREVRKTEREWLDAYEHSDAEAMNRILSDDFKLTFPNGSVQTKANILAQLKSGQNSGRPSPKFSTADEQSRVEGDAVILTGRVIQTMERDGQTRTMQMRYTDTYMKRQGRWQVVASKLTSQQ
ncbi:MAG: DUF4440 domain-containing protein [Pyrinomonadaceae bacterium]